MKESDFVRQNKEKWKSFEHELKNKSFKPNRVTDFYIDTLDDLSFARTHYPNRQVRSYLNGVAQLLSLRVYRTQRTTRKNLVKFWVKDLPLVMYQSQKQLLLSFLLLVFACAIGVLSSIYDPEFLRFILGDDYVNMTLENIEKGDPMGVYKDGDQSDMFFRITVNNIRVAAYTFVSGLFIGIGTILVMLYNGVMLGAFQYFFVERGLGFESFLTIWQHGAVEISSIVLASTAGLVLAKGVLFPGTHSRLNAFRISGRKSLIIMLSLFPLFIYAGFVESFVTRYTDLHWIVRLSTILLSLFFMLAYFVWYPRRVAAKHKLEDNVRLEMQPIETSVFSKKALLSGVQIAGSALMALLSHLRLLFVVGLAAGITCAIWLVQSDAIAFSSLMHPESTLQILDFYDPQIGLHMLGINALLFSLSYLMATYILLKLHHENANAARKATIKRLGMIALFGVVSALIISNYFSMALLLAWLPTSALLLVSAVDRGSTIWEQISNVGRIAKTGFWRTVGMMLLVLISVFFAGVFLSNILGLLIFAAVMVVPDDTLTFAEISAYLSTAYFSIGAMIIYTFVLVISGVSYYTMNERTSARSLQSKMDELFPKMDLSEQPTKGILSKTNLENT